MAIFSTTAFLASTHLLEKVIPGMRDNGDRYEQSLTFSESTIGQLDLCRINASELLENIGSDLL